MFFRFLKFTGFFAVAVGLSFGLTGCKKKQVVSITPLCLKIHQHILSLLQQELVVLSAKPSTDPKHQKAVKKYTDQIKGLQDARGKERSLRVCSLSSRKPKALVAHKCASRASSLEAARLCYQPPLALDNKHQNMDFTSLLYFARILTRNA